jgi:hypothetical protein
MLTPVSTTTPVPIIWPKEILIRSQNFNFFVTVGLAIVYPGAIYLLLTYLRHRPRD